MIIYDAEQSIKDIILENSVSINGEDKLRTVCDATAILDNDSSLVPPEELLKEIKPVLNSTEDQEDFDNLTKDVISLSSVLVTDIWNKNDSVFTHNNLIEYYGTAKYKPINWQHKNSEITGNENIGVMIVPSLVSGEIDNLSEFSGNKLDKDVCTGNLHVKQQGIIWSSYFPSYTNNIVNGFQKDNLFVSVELFFEGWDYAIAKDPSNFSSIQFIERNENNAHLSKQLRFFKGSGKVIINNEEYRIGLVPNLITISGQGVVSKPANAINDKNLSVILDVKSQILQKTIKSGYNNTMPNKGNNNMTDVDKLQAEIQQLQQKNDELVARLATANETELKEKIESLEAQLETTTTERDSLQSKVSEFEANLENKNTELATVKSELDEIKSVKLANDRLEELQTIIADVYSDDDLEDLKSMNEDTYNTIKTHATRMAAGVSNQAKSTDQTVSGQAKSTDQTISNVTKSTQASEEEVKSLETAKVNQDEAADLNVESADISVNQDKLAATTLVNFAMKKMAVDRSKSRTQ